jgi:peroxisomal 3,2-trans-enoyl-CoA isomerase
LCRKLGANFNESGPVASSAPAATSATSAAKPADGLLVKTEGRVRTITLNRPDKRNAITFAMYHDICAALDDAAADPAISVTVLTGSGAFFCSGNDLSNFANIPKGGPQELAEQGRVTLQKYVGKFITFPKYLVAALNGPAVGIAVTTLPLFDAVYASHKATLHAPLTALGQSPEGASSFTFPRAIGVARANDLLLLGRKISAQEGKEWGLVNEVFDEGSFQAEVAERVKSAASLPPQALTLSKKIMRDRDIPAMEAANDAECKLIKERWLSEECMSAIMAFLSKSSPKK